MYALLHQYLVESRQVFVDGFGVLRLVRHPAAYDVASQQVLPPSFVYEIEPGPHPAALQQTITYISHQQTISESEALARYKFFCQELKKGMDAGQSVVWPGLGVFQKNNGQEGIAFVAAEGLDTYYEPVSAHRVIRQGASHTLTVGTNETTSLVMREMLEKEETQSADRWWIAPAILAAAAVALIVLKKMGYM